MKSTSEDIQVANIESELDRLRKAQQSSHACLFNLIVYANLSRSTALLESIAKRAMERFPCRIIFIKNNVALKESRLRIDVSHESHEAAGSQIASERIDIEASPNELYRAPFIVTSHITTDLPTHLLWGDDIAAEESPLFAPLASLSKRVLFISEATRNEVAGFCQALLQKINRFNTLQFIDINWVEINGWREILSQVFNSPQELENLRQLAHIEIRYNSASSPDLPAPFFPALYLTAWLASRLKWKQIRQKGHHLLCTNAQAIVDIALQQESKPALFPGTLLSLDLTTSNECNYSLFPIEDLAKVGIHISYPTTCQLPYTLPLACLKSGIPYIKDLFFSDLSPHYIPMLQALAQAEMEP